MVIMVKPGWSQADADGMSFGYLGVKISGTDVWTTAHGTLGRRLGPLAGSSAGIFEPRRSRIGIFISSVLLAGDVPPKNARLYIAFPDGTRYERLMLPWVSDFDWPKIATEVGRFNSAAYMATSRPSRDDQAS
jgi:hypothetical protein